MTPLSNNEVLRIENLLEIYDSIAKNLALIIGNDTDPTKLIYISPTLEKHIFQLRRYSGSLGHDSMDSSSLSMHSYISAKQQLLET